MSSIQLQLIVSLLLIAGPYPTQAFQVGADSHPSPKLQPSGNADLVHAKTRASYDLGLGRNPPVRVVQQQPSSSHAKPVSTSEAVRFLNEHQSTRDFPQPSLTLDDEQPMIAKPEQSPQVPTHEGIQYQRSLEDCLTVHTSVPEHWRSKGNHPQKSRRKRRGGVTFPVIEKIASMSEKDQNVKLDVNSAWVEMLLHHQEMKLNYDRAL